MQTKEVVGIAVQLSKRGGDNLANDLINAYTENDSVVSEQGELDQEEMSLAYPEYKLQFGVEERKPTASLMESGTAHDKEVGHDEVFEFMADYVHPSDRASVWSMLAPALYS